MCDIVQNKMCHSIYEKYNWVFFTEEGKTPHGCGPCMEGFIGSPISTRTSCRIEQACPTGICGGFCKLCTPVLFTGNMVTLVKTRVSKPFICLWRTDWC